MANRAVFINPEGLLHDSMDRITQVNQLTLLSGTALAIRRLNDAGIFCCLISNQEGLARGTYNISHFQSLQKRLRRLLKKEAKAKIDGYYYCPYLSPCSEAVDPNLIRWSTSRKPNTGMLIRAAWEHDLSLRDSFIVGDEALDLDLAHNAGLKGILVKTERGDQVLKGTFQHRTRPDHIALNLAGAIDWLISVVNNQ
ncbi:MAG: D-glycero-alpha-D-manno-heptose-1,7-bisphosphate 7-phosphatase [Microcystaceae cyanobacterium]